MADAWALQKLGEYQNGKIILWSWLSRGLVTMEQVANWRFDGSTDAVEKLLDSTPTELKALCDLDALPDVEDLEQKKQVVLAQEAALQGEVASAWAILDKDEPVSDPIVLPPWFTRPIATTLLIWRPDKEIGE